jgi:hypothetical protein
MKCESGRKMGILNIVFRERRIMRRERSTPFGINTFSI